MTGWQPWNRAEHPEQLADFVQTGVTRLLLPGHLAQRLPASGDGRSPQEKARTIYEVFCDVGIRYVHEPATSTRGGQEIRPPDQVLARPKHGTCIDLALLYAGACLDAGLHPVVVVVDSIAGLVSHAVVAVWLGGGWALNSDAEGPLGGEVFMAPPHLDSGVSLVDAVRPSEGGAGSFVAVDVQALAHLGQAGPRSWSEAVSRGHDMVAATRAPDGEWRWAFGVDVGEARRLRRGFGLPGWLPADRSTLVAAYGDPVDDLSPLTQLKARSGMVPYVPSDELDLLIEWVDPVIGGSEQAGVGEQQKVALRVLTGVGGCGKTHLAAELCRRFSGQGWYTGFVPKHPTLPPDALGWLTGVISPVLAVVDYADEFSTDDLVRLLKALSAREQPTRVLLTARSDGPWLTELTDALQRDSVGTRLDPPIPLARRHRHAGMLYRRTFEKFVADGRNMGASHTHLPQQTNWTTLDVVIQAWLAATSVGSKGASTTQTQLYEEVLDREFRYWQRAVTGQLRPAQPQPEQTTPECQDDRPTNVMQLPLVPTARLAQAGAALTLVAPEADEVLDVLERLGPSPAGEPSWGQLGRVLARLLVEPSGGLAVRPDPVGEYLVLRECRVPALVDAVLPHPPVPSEGPATAMRKAEFRRRADRVDRELIQATEVVSRAAQLDRTAAIDLAEECLAARPNMWHQALDHARRHGGVFADALEVLAKQDDSPLPLETLAALPPGHGALRGVALAAVTSLKPVLPESPNDADWARLAAWLNDYAVRLGEVGDRAGALTAIDEAVTIHRRLAEANPGAFLPDLAGSLNNQAAMRSEVGDRAGALTAIDEAVTHYRRLAEANPGAFLPNLAMSLNNQAAMRSEVGDLSTALQAFADSWEGLPASSQAHLRTARVRWLIARRGWGAGTVDLLITDCAEASRLAEDLSEEAHLIGPARRAVAGTVAGLSQQRPELADRLSSVLPVWALSTPDDDVVSLCNDWLGSGSWSQQELFLTEHLDRLRDPNTRADLRTLCFQQPEARGLALLERLLDDIDEHGVEQVLTQARHDFTLGEELRDWLETSTWRESERFLVDHRHLLTDNDALSSLASFGDGALVQQHLGLLMLSASVGIDTAYAARADAETAVNVGNELIEKRSWPAVVALLWAAPGLAERPFALTYIILLLDAVNTNQGADWTPNPELIEQALRQGTPDQRKVAAGRLRHLLRDHPGQPPSLTTLADALTPADE